MKRARHPQAILRITFGILGPWLFGKRLLQFDVKRPAENCFAVKIHFYYVFVIFLH